MKCYVKPGKADIVQIPFKQNQADDAANSTKCIDSSPKVTQVRPHFLLLPFYCALSTLGDLSNWHDIPLTKEKILTRNFSFTDSRSYYHKVPLNKGPFGHGALVIVNLHAFLFCSVQISKDSLLASMIITNSTMYM